MQNIKFDLYFILDFYIFRNYQKCLFKLKPFGSFWKFLLLLLALVYYKAGEMKGLRR